MRRLLGEAGYEQPSGPRPVPAGASPKRKIPEGSGDRVTRFPRVAYRRKTENYLSAFSGELHCAVFLDR